MRLSTLVCMQVDGDSENEEDVWDMGLPPTCGGDDGGRNKGDG